MKTLVLYYSQSGRTKTVAEAIYAVAKKECDAELKELKDFSAVEFSNFDLVFVGSPCISSDLANPIKELLEKIPENPQFKLAGFVTHSCYPPEKGGIYEQMFEKWVGKCNKTFEKVTSDKNASYMGFFRCMGAPTPAIENFIHTQVIQDEKAFNEYVEDARKHPDELDVKNAQEFAVKMIKKSYS